MNKYYSNIRWAMHNQWEWAKERVIFTMARVPIAVIIAILQLYFPVMIVSQLEKHYSVAHICATIAVYIVVSLIVTLIENYRYSRSEKYRYYISNIYQLKLVEKHWRTDYENTENPNITQEYNLAYGDSMGECGPDEMLNTMVDLFISILGILTYSGIILSFSFYFVFPVFLSALVTYLTGRYQIKYFDEHAGDNEFVGRKMSYVNRTERSVKSAKEVRVYSMSHWLDDMFVKNAAESLKLSAKNRMVNTKVTLINSAVLLLQNVIVYTVLTIQIVNGKITASDYIFLLALVTGFSGWFIGVINEYNHLISQAVATRHYRNYLELSDRTGSTVDTPDDDQLICGPAPSIRFDNVGYRYPGAEEALFEGFNLEINPGEKIAIVGDNGSGKTTLVKLMCGLYNAQSGDIYVGETNSRDISPAQYYRTFSVVFQDTYLLPLKIKEFVAATDEGISEERVITALKRAGLYEKVMSLHEGIETPLMKGVRDGAVDLSGGETQKLMLARAFYKDGPVFVFDEPTSALDPIAEMNLYKFIDENTSDKTVVFISHRLASVKFCDRIVVIENGRIAEIGSHEELIQKKGKYAKMYNLQSKYYES